MKFDNLTTLLGPLAFAGFAAGWDYSDGPNGPANWFKEFPTCQGEEQSPIDIPAASAFREELVSGDLLTGFSFNYTEPEGGDTYQLENLGTTIEIHVTGKGFTLVNASNIAFLVGRSNTTGENEYTLEQLHFHWGLTDDEGSEHTFAGETSPMELHFVHFNSFKFDSFQEAFDSGSSDALFVVGVYFNIDETNTSTVLQEFLPVVTNENFTAGTEFEVENFSISDLVSGLGSEERKFFNYAGGLTTPPCVQLISFAIMKQRLEISREVLEAFRGIFGEFDTDEGKVILAPNFRPLQDLNGRPVIDAESKTVARVADLSNSPAVGASIGLGALLVSILVLLI